MMLSAMLVTLGLTVALFTYLMLLPAADKIKISRRVRDIQSFTADPKTEEEKVLSQPFLERVVKPGFDRAGKRILAFTPVGMQTRLTEKIARAGNPVNSAEFAGYKVLCGLGMAAAYALLFLLSDVRGSKILLMLVLALLSVLLAFFLPEVWLSSFSSKRARNLEKDLPDVLDLLTVAVEAGLGFDGAIQKVSEQFKDPIAGELRAYLKEVRLGYPRTDALRNLAARTNNPDIQTFVAAIVQADQLGVGISKVLRVQAEQMRIQRKQRAQERAMQLPVKMIFPLVLFIFPTIFAVLLGPVVIHLLGFFK